MFPDTGTALTSRLARPCQRRRLLGTTLRNQSSASRPRASPPFGAVITIRWRQRTACPKERYGRREGLSWTADADRPAVGWGAWPQTVSRDLIARRSSMAW